MIKPVHTREAKWQQAEQLKQESGRTTLKIVVWIYFALLIFEGVLRKWIAPQLAGPLLLVRDPVMLLIIAMVAQQKLMPRLKYLEHLNGFAVACFILLLLQMGMLKVPMGVLLFGWRTNVLHFYLIFLLPVIFTRRDILRLGYWCLVLAIPMAILMVMQFRSDPDSFLNRGAGEGSAQLASAMGKIRPAGMFSFITGPVAFFALVTAFVTYGISSREQPYPKVLVMAAMIFTAIALVVSGSRSAVLSSALVVVGWIVGLILSKQLTAGLVRTILLGGLAILLFGWFGNNAIFKEGTEVMSTRWEQADSSESKTGGMSGRYLEQLTTPLRQALHVPLWGYGLGVGTNVGAKVIAGELRFLLAEGEWGRLIMESGPILGLAFILFRISLVLWLGREALKRARAGDMLPLLLYASCALSLLNGQIAQTTALGFVVLSSGMCHGALVNREGPLVPLPGEPKGPLARPARVAGSKSKRTWRGPLGRQRLPQA